MGKKTLQPHWFIFVVVVRYFMDIELNENVKEKLSEAVKIWADENLEGKPALLANAIYFSLESEFIKKIKEINDKF